MNLRTGKKIDGTLPRVSIWGQEGHFKLTFKDGVLIKKEACAEDSASEFCYISPAFADSHFHFTGYAIYQASVDLMHSRSIENIQQQFLDHMNKYKPAFLFGEGWDDSSFTDGGNFTGSDLDKISRELPIAARRIDGHKSVVNSAAAEMLIKKGCSVDPQGILMERDSINLGSYFNFSRETVERGFALAEKKALSFGVLAFCDYVDPMYYAHLLKRSDILKELKIRYFTMEPFNLEDPVSNERIRYGGKKYFLDGSIGACTAATSFDYIGKGRAPAPFYTKAELLKLFYADLEALREISVHAIGDNAVRLLLEAIKDTKAAQSFRLEHLEFIFDRELELLEDLGCPVSLQPNFIGMWGREGGMYEKCFGDIYKKNNPLNSIVSRSGLPAFGSDGMPFSPSFGIYWAVNHPIEKEKIDLEAAIGLYSVNSFKLLKMDPGFLDTGSAPTFLYFDKMPDENRDKERFLEPDATINSGRTVYVKN
ncbi:amidohydrolase family protein [bacterium]|nr:amidohydrolase family protein [bacterium]